MPILPWLERVGATDSPACAKLPGMAERFGPHPDDERRTTNDGRAPPARAHHRRRSRALRRPLRARTKVMRSSAMRDLMEITARPEVISLAGGLPDTSTFPAESFAAQMTRIAQKSSAQALQYGPTEGFAETRECIREVMRAEGMEPDLDDVIVTTGGQQAIDLITKTLVDPGRRGDLRGAHLPGCCTGVLLLRGRDGPGGDGRRRDARSTSSRRSATGSRPRAGGRSSSTRCRPSRTPPG